MTKNNSINFSQKDWNTETIFSPCLNFLQPLSFYFFFCIFPQFFPSHFLSYFTPVRFCLKLFCSSLLLSIFILFSSIPSLSMFFLCLSIPFLYIFFVFSSIPSVSIFILCLFILFLYIFSYFPPFLLFLFLFYVYLFLFFILPTLQPLFKLNKGADQSPAYVSWAHHVSANFLYIFTAFDNVQKFFAVIQSRYIRKWQSDMALRLLPGYEFKNDKIIFIFTAMRNSRIGWKSEIISLTLKVKLVSISIICKVIRGSWESTLRW